MTAALQKKKSKAYSHLKEDRESGVFLYHTSCPKCGSSDGLAIYEKEEDGETYKDGYCWVCNRYFKPEEIGSPRSAVKNVKEFQQVEEHSLTIDDVSSFSTVGSKQRKIRKEFMEMYGVKMDFKENGAVHHHYYPVTKKGVLTGYKPRELPKNFKVPQIGDTKSKDADLFGQWIYESGKVPVSNKFLLITEGELDAIALAQALHDKGNQNFKNPVVSVPSGAGSAVKAIQHNWKWVNSFEQVVLFFDQDEPGRKAALEVAKTLPLGKCKIAKFSEKDPCDMLKAGKEEELYNALWRAETYAPEGVLAGSGLWNLVNSPLAESDARYPWDGLNKMLHGIRPSEMVTLTAGTGVAKSTFARMIAYYLQKTTDHNIGMIFLEESVKKTSLQIMSLEAGVQLHLPEVQVSEEEMRRAFDNTLGTGRYFFFDDFASQDFEAITEAIIYMARAANVKYIFLDHISMLVSGGEYGDERKALDAICTKLRSLVQQLDITLFAVSHLKRPQGVSHEEGGKTSLAQLRGSSGIAQLSDIVIGFERNCQAESEQERNTTHVRVLKNRFSGETGLACSLLFDKETGWAKQISEGETEEMDTSNSEFSDLPDEMFEEDFVEDY